MDIMKYKYVHFIGIGGISMSGLAEILKRWGLNVSGSDMRHQDTTKNLEEAGIEVFIGHKASNISEEIEVVVYTAAVKEDNEELKEARARNLCVIDRATLLGEVMKGYKYAVAVSGTHGKTTTTSMVSEIFMEANADPTITIGGILPSINSNIRIGASDYFVAEADEYCDSFLKFYPYVAIFLNLEYDHTDYYKSIEQMRQSYIKYANKIPQDGVLIINSKIENMHELIEGLKCRIITFGNEDSDWVAKNISYDSGHPSYDAYFKGDFVARVELGVKGEHNIYNSLSAFAAAYDVGIGAEHIASGLKAFGGAKRRFDIKGTRNGVTVVDDYAHHPTEVRATLATAKKLDVNNIWAVFQPHTYTRTRDFLDDFGASFGDADKIIITDIYAAREVDNHEVHATDLVEKIKQNGKSAIYLRTFVEINNYLLSNSVNGDIIITMGAGDIYRVGEMFLEGDSWRR